MKTLLIYWIFLFRIEFNISLSIKFPDKIQLSGKIQLNIQENVINNGIPKKFNRNLNGTESNPINNCGWMTKSRIVGGNQTDPDQYPWMAAIFRPEFEKLPICGGVLLNHQFIMTAAHCFYHKIHKGFMNFEIFTIRLGAHTFNGQNEVDSHDYTIDKIEIHENFDPLLLLNDIAIIKLKPSIEFSKSIRPICLPYNMTADLDGKDVMVAGWGLTEEFGTEQSETLQHTDLKVVSNEMCAQIYTSDQPIKNSMLCTFASGKDSCYMDSGGPVMIKNEDKIWSVVGIVSFGYECASETYPGVNTKVSYYINWIEKSMLYMN